MNTTRPPAIPKIHNDWLHKLLKHQHLFELLTLKEGDVIYLTNKSLTLVNIYGILSTVKEYPQRQSFTFALSPPDTLLHYRTNQSIYYHKVQALTKSYVIVFHDICDLTDQLIQQKIKLMELESLNSHLLYLENLVLLFMQNNIKKRVVFFVLTLAKQIGSFSDTNIVIHISLSHTYLAEALATTRASITRAIRSMSKDFILLEKKRVLIFNPIALANCVSRK